MNGSSVFFVGRLDEVGHHAAPFQKELNLQFAEPREVVQMTRPGDVAIFFSEHFDRFRQAIETLKRQQVATLYLIDGILEWRNAWENQPTEPACPFTMRPVLCHKVACLGPSQARVLESWGNGSKIEIVGVPRFDRICRLPPRLQNGQASFRLLVMTAKVPGFTSEQLALTQRSLQDLKAWIEREQRVPMALGSKKIEVIWRLTAGLEWAVGVNNDLTETTGAELIGQLLEVDAVIATPSTAMLEAMLLGLPVASLDYHNCPTFLPTAWRICQPSELSNVITELADPPAAKMFYQQMQLSDAIAYDRSGATDLATSRIIDLVRAMQEAAARQIAAGRPLEFEQSLLPPYTATRDVKASFVHADVYPQFAEIWQKDGAIAQVELAHARREIEHLQREIEQLKSELSQAHAILQQIQAHPVAGPIVRLRQKFLDWFSRNRGWVESP